MHPAHLGYDSRAKSEIGIGRWSDRRLEAILERLKLVLASVVDRLGVGLVRRVACDVLLRAREKCFVVRTARRIAERLIALRYVVRRDGRVCGAVDRADQWAASVGGVARASLSRSAARRPLARNFAAARQERRRGNDDQDEPVSKHLTLFARQKRGCNARAHEMRVQTRATRGHLDQVRKIARVARPLSLV